ncbi:restriction endonuclease subunit S [Neptunomonas phycophila]|uniref:Restriction endonuclease subunit S n=1 Tax=Neptunomonas phycophila TaxID=1572645 RepID=A0ABT9EQT0_9GAMM|nr:restriction endonuclease subunit S [Neptunomonas phycophila]MDP2521419.1 restriction endonuclease subunit S [Neptunomonas phycophila]
MDTPYSPYPKYKDTRIDWLGNIPEHWSTSKLRYMFSFGKGLPITKENLQDSGIPCLNYGEVHSKYGFEVDPSKHPLKFVGEEYLKSSPSALLEKGDIVFADTSEDIEGSGNFTQLISNHTIFAGYHTIIARPKDRTNSRFYAYLLDSQELRTQVRHAVKGVKVFSVTQAILRGIDIWLPDAIEQSKIANFLDHETAKIDTLIDKQQQLIKLLKEKRQAVISHAVTKGLNPNAPMKDSGVEWLGEVPVHWKSAKLKYLTDVIVDGAHFTPTYVEEGVPFLRVTDIQSEEVDLGRIKFIPKNEHEVLIQRCKPEKGDLLLSKNGTIGVPKVIDWDWEFSIFVSLCLIKFNHRLNSEYAYFYFMTHQIHEQIFGMIKQSTVINLHLDKIQDFYFSVPPIDEQECIVENLRDRLKTFDDLISKANKSISLSKERRTALISAAVTGKIDVRNFKAGDTHVV